MRIIKTKHEYDGKFEYEISSTGEGSSRQWWWFVLTLIIISLFVGDMHFMQKCLDELTCKLQNIFDLVRVLGILTMIIWIHKSRKKRQDRVPNYIRQ